MLKYIHTFALHVDCRSCSSTFWFDFVVSIPIEPIVAGGLGITVRDTQEAKFVGLLRWLRIGRMYPIFEVFATIQHKHILPPVVLTLARNYVSAPDHTQSSCTACFRTRELWECT
eukprot:scaffold77870_cov19-Tisochrysis_lutea.AAC.2